MELTILVSMISALVGIIIGIGTFQRNREKDVRAEAKNQGVMENKLDNITNGITNIQIKMEAQSEKWDAMDERLVRVEESTKSAHKRINAITGVKYHEEEIQR